jgi:chromosome segregation ATPase
LTELNPQIEDLK